jgi:hypothetical protein
MKKRLALAAMTVLGGIISTPAFAQTEAEAPKDPRYEEIETGKSGFYAGLGINLYFVDKEAAAEGMPIVFEDQPSPGAWIARVGYSFNEYIAVEVEGGFGAADSDFGSEDETFGNIGVGKPFAAHAVFTKPFGDGGGYGGDGYFMAKAGYATITIERELFGVEFEDVELSGGSFGLGAGMRGEHWDGRFEYSFLTGDANSGVLGMFIMRRF